MGGNATTLASPLPRALDGVAQEPDQALVYRAAAVPLAEGMAAFWRGDYGRAVDALLASAPYWPLLGGSQPQRDVFQLTLIHAAAAAGDAALARSLLAERTTLRYRSAPAWYMYGAALDAVGAPARAADARNHAYALGMGQGGPAY